MAVNDLCLGINEGECFGLLGPNGWVSFARSPLLIVDHTFVFGSAGKTTTLNVLSGQLKSSSGTCKVATYDVKTELELVYMTLGICPQFGRFLTLYHVWRTENFYCLDTVWEDLSVRDHLLFYARLKGTLWYCIPRPTCQAFICVGANKAVERALSLRAAETVELDGDPLNQVTCIWLIAFSNLYYLVLL